ncbi:hypothetical protein Rhe02_83970 [Rhizocola hellebori]|uniref:Uncharacterized protein n=1 Tax=Rhizocola hellebori TaxID=1392758 RepID=A0A8J3VL04_9ACTN|nr:VCBS repeat-containing protein [Rhizocola hellebori]GIH10330.1 hypothetical protein Rhe02_83970 [Rhizocola hellebori]
MFVRDRVSEASGGTVVPYGYQQGFANAGGVEVSASQAVRGDVIQVTPAGSTDATAESMYNPAHSDSRLHTAIIRQNLGDGSFAVIDSNWNNNQLVSRHNLNPYTWASGSIIKIWRLGTASSPATDTDGDATPDLQDVAPFTPGPINNRGIPDYASTLSGDFTGDGKADIAAFYDYGGAQTKLWLFPGTGNGFAGPVQWWDSGAGGWDWANTKPVAGDFTGDGKTDIAAFYGYGGSLTKLFLFTSTGTGFSWPAAVFDSGPGGWDWANTKPVAGDFTGDGKTDVAAFYGYGGSLTKLFLFTSTGTGLAWPTVGWNSGTGNWDLAKGLAA